MCLIFVFVALVQFAYVNVLSRAEKKRKQVDMIAVGCSPILESSKEEEVKKVFIFKAKICIGLSFQ